jgi:hypothetical protein
MRRAWLAWAGVCATVAAFSAAVACGGSAFTSGSGPDASSSGSSGSSGGSGSGSGGSSGAIKDGGGGDGAISGEGGTPDGDCADSYSTPTFCGDKGTCSPDAGQGYLCCIDPSAMQVYSCAACGCGCATELSCARPGDCRGTPGVVDSGVVDPVCCIAQQPCGGGSMHYVATCMARSTCDMTNRSAILCDVDAATGFLAGCGMNNCSPDTSNYGIPRGSGYGVCN